MAPSQEELQSFTYLREFLLNIIREIEGGGLDTNTVDALHFRLDWLHGLRVIFSEYRESEDTHEQSIFRLFHQNIPLGELIQGKIV